jgi:predicted PurR-regulated permease PerM
VSGPAHRLLFWLGVIAVVVLILTLLQSILLPFAAGIAIAFILAPSVDRLERHGVRRSLASLVVLTAFLITVACVFVLLVPLIQGQIVQLIGRVPKLIEALRGQVSGLMLVLQERLPAEEMAKLRDIVGTKLGEVVAWLASLFQSMITSSIAILNIVSLVLVMPIIAFFLLRDWKVMVAQIDSYLPRQSVGTVREQARLVSDMLVGFIHGQSLVCLGLAVYYGVTLSLAGLEAGLALGLLIGVLAIIPILGAAIGFLLALGLAASQYGTWQAVLTVCGIFALGQLIESNFLTPKLVGDRIHLHPVWVIFALFAGGTLFGFIGILIAVPAAAVIGVLVRFALARYRASTVYDPTQPTAGGLGPCQ